MEIEVYSRDLLCCSVCAPPEMSGADVAAEVERASPAGTSNGWQVSTDATFATGEPNGGLVKCHRGETRHWLLDC